MGTIATLDHEVCLGERLTHIQVAVRDGQLCLSGVGWEHAFHPQWLLERSLAAQHADVRTRQRLFEPTDIDSSLRVVAAQWRNRTSPEMLRVDFDDGSVGELSLDELMVAAGCIAGADELPKPEPWSAALAPTIVSWPEIELGEPSATVQALDAFHRFGWFVLSGAPTTPGSLLDVASRFGRVSATNFGQLFNVETKPEALDLAYTSLGLTAHTDQPYRRPVPGIQFLHTLVNTAAGGSSTVADGLAATDALRQHDPEGAALLERVVVEFRYDVGTDVVVDRAPIIERGPHGELRQLRFSPRLDFPPALDVDQLDRFYAARRWLACWFADPAHKIEFTMSSGDVLVVDNHRVVHGRTEFDPASGHRHLQGCYIDHDGPATKWRLEQRRQRASNVRTHL